MKKENVVLGTIISGIILLQPLPNLNFGMDSPSSLWIGGSYSMAWINANAHILQTVLLVGAIFFLVYSYKPLVSALFSFGCLDPRMGLLALPILVWYSLRVKKSKRFILYTILFLALENLPFFLYNNIGESFILADLNFNVVSQFYAYELIPIFSILCLSVLIFWQKNDSKICYKSI